MSSNFVNQTQSLELSAPEKLNVKHDLSQFDCLEQSINEYLRKAHKQASHKNAVIYVVCEKGTKIVRGFYTLSNGSVARNEAPKNMQRFSMSAIPVTILGRLGVDTKFQGNGVGQDLLKDALTRCISASELIGSRAVLVHALDEKRAEFYKKNAGFQESPISPMTLFMSL